MAAKSIPLPGKGVKVLSRHVRVAVFNKSDVRQTSVYAYACVVTVLHVAIIEDQSLYMYMYVHHVPKGFLF